MALWYLSSSRLASVSLLSTWSLVAMTLVRYGAWSWDSEKYKVVRLKTWCSDGEGELSARTAVGIFESKFTGKSVLEQGSGGECMNLESTTELPQQHTCLWVQLVCPQRVAWPHRHWVNHRAVVHRKRQHIVRRIPLRSRVSGKESHG